MNDKDREFRVLGVTFPFNNMDVAVKKICDAVEKDRTGQYVCVTGVHGIMESQRDPDVMTAHHNAMMCVPDGMPVVWIGRKTFGSDMGRVYGPDLMLALLEKASNKGYSSFFYGGKDGIAEQLSRNIKNRFAGLVVTGTYSPPFRPLTAEEEEKIIRRINEASPDILWIGLSTPKQELLMSRWSDRIRAKVMIGVGAAFDFHTGHLVQAPAWMQRIGMEWFFRLCIEPRRLWKRYLINNPAFIWCLLLEKIGLRKQKQTE